MDNNLCLKESLVLLEKYNKHNNMARMFLYATHYIIILQFILCNYIKCILL